MFFYIAYSSNCGLITKWPMTEAFGNWTVSQMLNPDWFANLAVSNNQQIMRKRNIDFQRNCNVTQKYNL